MSAFSFQVAESASGLAVNCKSPLSAGAAGQGWQKCAVVRRLPRAFLLEFVKNQSASDGARPGQC